MGLLSNIIYSAGLIGSAIGLSNLFSQMSSDITRGGFTPNNSEILEPTTPTTKINIKWRSVIYSETLPGTAIQRATNIDPFLTFGDPIKTYGDWQEGGVAELYSRFCHGTYVANAFKVYSEFWQVFGITRWYNIWQSTDFYIRQYQTIEIDWADLSTKLKTYKPLSENQIISAAWGSAEGYSLDMIQNNIFDTGSLNTVYYNGDYPTGLGEVNPALIEGNILPSVQYSMITVGITQQVQVQVCSGGSAQQFVPYAHIAADIAGCEKYEAHLPMEVNFYFKSNITDFKPNAQTTSGIGNANDYTSPTPGGSNIGAGAQSENATTQMDNFVGSKSSSKVSETSGINPIEIFNGNSIIPYDSIYMSGVEYNQFVAAGGGIVAESGLYPNDRNTIFITNISLSIDGNTMKVLQNSDFDATPLLSLNERVYGYIININGDYECSFAGFVFSISKHMEGKAEYIEYECRCLKYYLSHVTTPSYVIYQPPGNESDDVGKTYDQIIKDILTRIGLTNTDITLPDILAPELEYNYTPIKNVLEDLVSYLGKYTYYTTKNGILTIKSIDSGSLVGTYRIPTRGESVGTHKVSSFTPTQDMTLSRSRIIITGDYSIKEIESIGTYQYPEWEVVSPGVGGSIGTIKPKDQYIIDPRECNKTGIFCYLDSGSGQYITYFMFRPGKTIVSRLISNPQVTAEFIKIYSGMNPYVVASNTTVIRNSEGNMAILLPIEYVSPNIGNSFYFMYKWVRPELHSITVTDTIYQDKYLAVSQKYCIREDEPIKVIFDTGEVGGIEVVKIPEFKKIASKNYNRDDTSLMRDYAALSADYYKPAYGGQLVIQGLENQLNLLDKVSITNTNLPSIECTNLVIHSIDYDLINRETTIELSNRLYLNLPFFDYRGELRRKEAALQNNIAATDQLTKYQAKRR